MRRQLSSHLRDLQSGVRPEDVMHHDHRRSVHHPHAHGRIRPLGETLGVHDRAAAQLVQVEVRIAELKQAGAELVLVRIAVLLDEAVRLERLQKPVDGGSCEPQPIGELAHSKPPRATPQGLQDAGRAVDRLDHSPLRATPLCSVPSIRHCRIGFESVD